MAFITYSIGRSKNSNIVLTDSSVSRTHAELTIIEGSSRVFVIDCNSSGGLYRQNQASWEQFSQSFLYLNDSLKFGEYTITVESLVDKVKASNAKKESTKFEPVSFRPKRNTDTGEIQE